MDRWLFLLSGIWSHLWMCAYERGLTERGPNKYIRPKTTLELTGFVHLSEKKRNTKKCSFLGLDFLRGVEWRVDLCAPVHDSGMIKDLYCILILLLCCQQPFPVPNTHTSVQTYAAVHNSTVGAENGKPVSCDGKTECIISICMEWRSGAVKASQPRRIFPRTMREGCYMISDYS